MSNDLKTLVVPSLRTVILIQMQMQKIKVFSGIISDYIIIYVVFIVII